MSNLIQNRSELVFCYDVKDINPNGDPADENKPRIDEESNTNLVTDTRLKRTIRDYLYDYKGYNGKNGKDIFVREVIYDKENEYIKTAHQRAGDFDEAKDEILEKCIDIRLFGGAIPLGSKSSSIKLTGPVQFRMGRSLNDIDMRYLKGTGAFASKKKATQKTFRDEYILPYSLINFYGVINENAAKTTKLTESDIDELIEAMWMGTKNLITRSKIGHMPRFLLKVSYKKKGFHIGDLEKYLDIKVKNNLNEMDIRDVDDYIFKIDKLINILSDNKDKIKNVEYKIDDRLELDMDIPSDWQKLEI
ncbi:MAG: type I-B CRISPR-associated protein Cas7/Csh2 [Candidatus Mcinerneyibacterium aminivorans]|uniref:Type I-B CRISPR-associated protein Cas7/Csh2 n=1 Tax=Candidatus Mcinerneyibacterium aminivorans TaxID=2703815 RepID=A0A5D0MDU6_9BACT|nr:MAG: type I-B CRISPR-associated protein Cas7/Csh2 [Candidatus Mcinerneyibacterium aminivorans]